VTDINASLPFPAAIAESLALGGHVRVGVDRVELTEFTRIVTAGGAQLLETVYTASELEHCQGRIEKLATRFAAKEATTKALGTGLRGVGLNEIEVVTASDGQPSIALSARAKERARSVGISEIAVSMTHTAICAEAFVVGLTRSDTSRTPSQEETMP
jgi:holo-[acyl-carrier protein] synthase